MLTTIPFQGLYESMWSQGLDDAEEYLIDGLTGENDSGEGEDGFRGHDRANVSEALYWTTNYGFAHNWLAKEYATDYAAKLDEVAGWKLRLKFDEMLSPREYNFTTDRVFMTLPRSTVRRLRKECDRDVLDTVAKERFTSYDGFISSYSPYVSDWGPLDKWDHNQVGTLLIAWIKTKDAGEIEQDVFDDWSGNGVFDEALDEGLDLEAAKARLHREAA